MGLPRCFQVRPGGGPLIGLSVAAEAAETEFWGGITAGDMQSDIEIADGVISGTLAYVPDFSAAGFDPADGNFIALKVSSTNEVEGVTYTCTIIDGDGAERSVTLDEDQNIVIQIKDKATQKLRFTGIKEGYVTDVVTLALSGLTCESAPDDDDEQEGT